MFKCKKITISFLNGVDDQYTSQVVIESPTYYDIGDNFLKITKDRTHFYYTVKTIGTITIEE